MLVRYRYRLLPSPGQRQALARMFGCAASFTTTACVFGRNAAPPGQPMIIAYKLGATGKLPDTVGS